MVRDKAARAFLGAPQELAERLEKSRLPHEVNRVDVVTLPELEVLGRDCKARRFLHQPAVSKKHDSERFLTVSPAQRGLKVLTEDCIDVAAIGFPFAFFRELAQVEIDQMRAQARERLWGNIRASRRGCNPRWSWKNDSFGIVIARFGICGIGRARNFAPQRIERLLDNATNLRSIRSEGPRRTLSAPGHLLCLSQSLMQHAHRPHYLVVIEGASRA